MGYSHYGPQAFGKWENPLWNQSSIRRPLFFESLFPKICPFRSFFLSLSCFRWNASTQWIFSSNAPALLEPQVFPSVQGLISIGSSNGIWEFTLGLPIFLPLCENTGRPSVKCSASTVRYHPSHAEGRFGFLRRV